MTKFPSNRPYFQGLRRIDAEIRKLQDDIERLEKSQRPTDLWALAYQQTRLDALRLERQQFKRDYFSQRYNNQRRLPNVQLQQMLGPVPPSSQNTEDNFR